MKRRSLIILLSICAVVFLIITCCVVWWYNETHTGSRSGQVIDAVTGKPIEGVVVNYTWHVAGFLEDAIGSGGPTISYETLTDKEGKYYIPNLRVKRRNIFQWGLQPEEVIVYKDKYAAYKLHREYKKSPIGWSFGYLDIKQPYHEKNNIVKLYPWKEGESHYRQVDWIHALTRSAGQGELLRKELVQERKRADEEMSKKWK